MKFSQFNIHTFYKEKFVLYNSFSDRFLLVEPLLQQLIEAATQENNPTDLATYHPQFFNALQKNGFIIDAQIDEIEEVKKLRNAVDLNNETTYQLVINP